MTTTYDTIVDSSGQIATSDESRTFKRKTYPQIWPAYNAAQTSEKDHFKTLLADLCANVEQPKYIIGRSRFPLADMVYVSAIKIYSGFSARRFNCDVKEKSQRQWLKAHIITGVKTNIVTSIKITDGHANDSPVLPGLLNDTAVRFDMVEVSADKAYLSENNLRSIENHGAAPYIPFKSNTTGQGSGMWRRLYAYFIMNEDEWKGHYHQRSNVETTFSMVKGKFGDALRSKSDEGQVNEILLKFLCHNICVLIQEMHELGITPDLKPVVEPDMWRN